jgi:murein DD-endopeptidase MepM/ murein hydrolase activator NlpD
MSDSDHNGRLPLDEMAVMQEPPFDPEDTPASGIIRRSTSAPITDRVRNKRGRSWINWLLSGAAAVITLTAAVLYLQQNNQPTPPATRPPAVARTAASPTARPTGVPTQVPVAANSVENSAAGDDAGVPADVVAELLMRPGDTAPAPDKIYRMQTAYTIAPARNRSGVISYTIQQGDTLDKIAQRFGISKDTLIWNNDGIYVNRLLPGDTLDILPEDGVLHKTAGEETIQSIADKYKVSPYAIIDSEYNKLQNASPTTLLPPSMSVMVPGGTSTKKAAYWDPGTTFRKAPVVTGGSGASVNATGEVSFGGGPGSCGYQPNGGGTGALRVPLPPGYQVVRGFSSFHSGIDLAMPAGTTVFAADGGTVIFAGWSNWGYGNSIVLAHGNMLTLYGHLSRVSVRCGQRVTGGQPIGAVGSTGQSSGPHLHFEIRPGGGEPVNPAGYLAF